MTRETHPGAWGRVLRATVATAALFLAARAARAQTCSFTTVSGVSFGNYDALEASPLDQTGSITIQCSGLDDAQTVTVDFSTGSSGSYASRRMQKGADSLGYNLYLDATMLHVWGDGTPGTFHFGPVLPVLGGVDETVTIYGRIPARQASPVGAYTDTVTATINF